MGSQHCEVIHNPIDTDTFSPVDKDVARQILGLPVDRKLVLLAFDATSEQRKGYDLLVAALHHLERDCGVGQDTEVVVLGGARPVISRASI